jgi:ABC-type transport system involved in cytochrome bd biosynthesis fused ATPase/permease subunit
MHVQQADIQGRFMWIPKDEATWLWILALILVIPLHFFSLWAYPKVQDWWAARSRKSLRKRIDKLSASVAKMNKTYGREALTEDWVGLCTEQLGSLVYWVVNTLAVIVIIVAVPTIRSTAHPNLIAFILLLILFAYTVARDYLMAEIRRLRSWGGPIVRAGIEKSIADLTQKLAAREPRKSA